MRSPWAQPAREQSGMRWFPLFCKLMWVNLRISDLSILNVCVQESSRHTTQHRSNYEYVTSVLHTWQWLVIKYFVEKSAQI